MDFTEIFYLEILYFHQKIQGCITPKLRALGFFRIRLHFRYANISVTHIFY